jgi:hypothetical protein
MTDAIALLKLALALLVAAQQPNVPADLRQAAVNLASSAITQAIQEEVRSQVASSTASVAPPKQEQESPKTIETAPTPVGYISELPVFENNVGGYYVIKGGCAYTATKVGEANWRINLYDFSCGG